MRAELFNPVIFFLREPEVGFFFVKACDISLQSGRFEFHEILHGGNQIPIAAKTGDLGADIGPHAIELRIGDIQCGHFLGDRKLGSRQFRLSLIHSKLVWGRIDSHHRRARFDKLVVIDEHLLSHAENARADICHVTVHDRVVS